MYCYSVLSQLCSDTPCKAQASTVYYDLLFPLDTDMTLSLYHTLDNICLVLFLIFPPFENHILDFGIVYVDSLLFPPSMSIKYRALLPKLCY